MEELSQEDARNLGTMAVRASEATGLQVQMGAATDPTDWLRTSITGHCVSD